MGEMCTQQQVFTILGFVFFAMGFFSMISQILCPYSLIGAMGLTCCGLILLLFSSDELRAAALQHLPLSVRELIYER